MEYFKEARVRELNLSGGVAKATVRGTRNYRVEVDIDHDFESTCTCPYDFGGYCKHIVATLIALAKDYQGVVERGKGEEKRVDDAMQAMSAEQLRDFLKKEFLSNKVLKYNFMIHATSEMEAGGRSLRDYKEEIRALYDDASDDGYIGYGDEIDFTVFVDLGRRFAEKKNFVEAAKVYQALSEVIAENMNMVDDSDGYYGDKFWQAIESLCSCINSLEGEGKAGYINNLFEKFMKKEPDYFRDDYDEALRRVCITKDHLELLRKLLWPHLPSSLPDSKKAWSKYYDSMVLLGMQVFVLDGLAGLGDGESRREFYELLKRHYLQDEEFCLLYSERLEKDGRLDEAIKVAEEGLRRFPANLTRELRVFLNRQYETLSPDKYRENLKELFFQEMEWGYYERLKKLSGNQWNSVLQEIVKHFSSRRAVDDYYYYEGRTILIDIYMREKMFDAALREVLSRKSVRSLSRYYKYLAERYPKEYYTAYKELLLPYADARTGRDHYHEVASELKKMKAIKGFEKEFAGYINIFRERYARKPAFLDEMRRL